MSFGSIHTARRMRLDCLGRIGRHLGGQLTNLLGFDTAIPESVRTLAESTVDQTREAYGRSTLPPVPI